MNDAHIVEAVAPETAFSVLADESRIDILRALWETDGQTATFSELRAAVEMTDSGKFNYHLGKLTDRFVRKTDGGYELREAGRQIVGALLSGAYTMEGAIDPIDLDDPCPLCGDALTFAYEDERATIDCAECSFESTFPIPPGAFADYPTDQFPELADRYLRTLLSDARNDFCSACEGRIQLEMRTEDTPELPPSADGLVMVSAECDRCGSRTQMNLATLLLDHPAVVAFHHDRGIDLRSIKLWQLGSPDGVPRSTITQGNSSAATVTYTADDEQLTLHVDEDLTVVSTERESG